MSAAARYEIEHCPAPELEDFKVYGNLDGIMTISISAGGLTVVASGARRQLLGIAEQVMGALKRMEPGK